MYLLDTVVLSEARKASCHGAVKAWLITTPQSQQFVPAVAFGEIERGLQKTRIHDSAKATQIESWMRLLLTTAQIVPMDGAMFVMFQTFLSATGRNDIEDLMIAATARVRGLMIVTRNVRDFRGFGVPIFDPWTGTRIPA